MVDNVKVACIQMNSGKDVEENLKQAGELIKDAAKEGAEFIATPENTDFIRENHTATLSTAFGDEEHPGIPFFGALAKQYKVWLLIGSMKIKVSDDKVVNRSFLFRDNGQLEATYDKIHLFDVDLLNGESHRESDFVQAGTKAVIANTAWRKVGMSICYDVRFPYLYRDLAKNGAEMIAVPAAFTAYTGKAHWETLLRARAIETGSYILAAAQGGRHEGGRMTYGHSMIVSPWGHVLAHKEDDEPGFITTSFDFLNVTKARHSLPALKHDRKFDMVTPRS